MGEYAEMTLSGEFCESCGEYMGDGNGYPLRCNECHLAITTEEVEKDIGRGENNGTSRK